MDAGLLVALGSLVVAAYAAVLSSKTAFWDRRAQVTVSSFDANAVFVVEVIRRSGREVRIFRCALLLPDGRELALERGSGYGSKVDLPAQIPEHGRIQIRVPHYWLGRRLKSLGWTGVCSVHAIVEDETRRTFRAKRAHAIDVDAWSRKPSPRLLA
jgi:hypothetical protein